MVEQPSLRRPRATATASPPRSVDHEPATALFASEPFPRIYERLARGAARVLRAGGALLVEIGLGQEAAVSDALERAGLAVVETHRGPAWDPAGDRRAPARADRLSAMDRIRVVGGRPLEGTVRISGAKNASLPDLCAALLSDEPVVLSNVPEVRDIRTMGRVLADLGAQVEFRVGGIGRDPRQRPSPPSRRPTSW